MKQYDSAISDFKLALQLTSNQRDLMPERPLILYALGLAEKNAGQSSSGTKKIQEALGKMPDVASRFADKF
jgi:hypothetical protein